MTESNSDYRWELDNKFMLLNNSRYGPVLQNYVCSLRQTLDWHNKLIQVIDGNLRASLVDITRDAHSVDLPTGFHAAADAWLQGSLYIRN